MWLVSVILTKKTPEKMLETLRRTRLRERANGKMQIAEQNAPNITVIFDPILSNTSGVKMLPIMTPMGMVHSSQPR